LRAIGFAPNAPHRGQVTPQVIPAVTPTEGDSITQITAADPSIETKAISARQLSHYCWAKLIVRVYETDPLLCGHCGGRMKIMAFVMQASEIKKILAHVGLPVEAARTHPARGPPQSDLWASATACEWEVNPTYPDAADQDQSLHW
jgi:hypothetical protein